MKFADAVVKLLESKNLRREEALSLFTNFFGERLEERQSKSLLVLLAKKGESPDEISGALCALQKFEAPIQTRFSRLMDTAGTGGDHSSSMNISTLAALVIAGAGGQVAKHGNRSITSRCGSSDLMEKLGVALEAEKKRMLTAIQKGGLGYFHAPFYHPAFSKFQPLRRHLKIRTLFNFLGPLSNPCHLDYQMIGVSRAEQIKTFAEVLAKIKKKRAVVYHSTDGMDEISCTSPTQVAWVFGKKILYETLTAKKIGLTVSRQGSLKGGSAETNREIALDLLCGKKAGLLRDTVLMNAAVGIYLCEIAPTLQSALHEAKVSLDTGRAYQSLLDLVRISQGKTLEST